MPNPEKQPLHDIYKGGFFKQRDKLLWRVPIFCDAVINVFKPTSVVDVGCAIGDFVKGFNDKNISSIGIEGSQASEPFMVTQDYFIHDLREPIDRYANMNFDLAMCLEVAEHIEPEYAEIFARNLTLLSRKILISAAPPGQKGHHHVNCQEIEYWDDIFEKLNFFRDDTYAQEVIEKIWDYRHKAGIKAYCTNLHFYKYLKG